MRSRKRRSSCRGRARNSRRSRSDGLHGAARLPHLRTSNPPIGQNHRSRRNQAARYVPADGIHGLPVGVREGACTGGVSEVASKQRRRNKPKGDATLSGAEAWSLVAPILARYAGVTEEGKLNLFSEAYVLIYGALKEHDERQEGDAE